MEIIPEEIRSALAFEAALEVMIAGLPAKPAALRKKAFRFFPLALPNGNRAPLPCTSVTGTIRQIVINDPENVESYLKRFPLQLHVAASDKGFSSGCQLALLQWNAELQKWIGTFLGADGTESYFRGYLQWDP